jgi:hypothetical protein
MRTLLYGYIVGNGYLTKAEGDLLVNAHVAGRSKLSFATYNGYLGSGINARKGVSPNIVDFAFGKISQLENLLDGCSQTLLSKKIAIPDGNFFLAKFLNQSKYSLDQITSDMSVGRPKEGVKQTVPLFSVNEKYDYFDDSGRDTYTTLVPQHIITLNDVFIPAMQFIIQKNTGCKIFLTNTLTAIDPDAS